MCTRKEVFDVVFEEKDSVTYDKESVVPGQCDTLAHWAALMIQMPKIASIARSVLPMQATSIPSERFFPGQGSLRTIAI